MLGPIQNLLTSLLTSLQPIAPLIGAVGVTIAAADLVLGNHMKARDGIICAFLGTAIMLGAQQMIAAIRA